jgi:hypothetical protein
MEDPMTLGRTRTPLGALLLSHGLLIIVAAGLVADPAASGRFEGDGQVQERTAVKPRPADAPALKEFEARVNDYADVQKTLAGKLTRLSDEATPQEIDKHERALAALIENARRTARPGDVFVPGVQVIVRRELGRIFTGSQGKQLIASIMDENPQPPPLRVNARYPDTVPMSTMPPEVLSVLPPLPKILNYRFVGDQLILLDTEAHIVVDFIARALPR